MRWPVRNVRIKCVNPFHSFIYGLDCLIITLQLHHWVQDWPLWSLSQVSLFKHQFVPLLNPPPPPYIFLYFLALIKAPLFLQCPTETEPSILFFVSFSLIHFQLSGQDLRGSADAHQGHVMALISAKKRKKASCVQLFAWITNMFRANGILILTLKKSCVFVSILKLGMWNHMEPCVFWLWDHIPPVIPGKENLD